METTTQEFKRVLVAFATGKKESHGWENEDIAYLVEEILKGASLPMIEAEIEVEIHGEVTWFACPACEISLNEEDVLKRCGFCAKCFNSKEKEIYAICCNRNGDSEWESSDVDSGDGGEWGQRQYPERTTGIEPDRRRSYKREPGVDSGSARGQQPDQFDDLGRGSD